MMDFFDQPLVAIAGIAGLVFAALLLLKVYTKLMSRVQ